MIKETLKVIGMHCPKCTDRVEKAACAIPGVMHVVADHEKDQVTVDYDGSKETMAIIKTTIEKEGFAVKS